MALLNLKPIDINLKFLRLPQLICELVVKLIVIRKKKP